MSYSYDNVAAFLLALERAGTDRVRERAVSKFKTEFGIDKAVEVIYDV